MIRAQKEIIRGLHNLRPEHRNCVVTIGSFDGVHLGHQAIVRQVTARAEALQLPAVVMVFEPLPAEYFSGTAAGVDPVNEKCVPARLMRFREKTQALFDAGIDRVLCLYFNESLRCLTASEFVNKVIVEGLGPRCVIVGDDFHFGRDRGGEFALLQQAGQHHGFEVVDTDTYTVDGQRVSSTRVRAALSSADFALAERLLGRPYTIRGRVSYGQQLGRQWGVPTANLLLQRCRSPVQGVFAVEVKLADGARYRGVVNVGVRPTLPGSPSLLLEAHLFDFQRLLYGQMIEVEFKCKLRDELAFETLDALKEQIYADIEAAKHYFG